MDWFSLPLGPVERHSHALLQGSCAGACRGQQAAAGMTVEVCTISHKAGVYAGFMQGFMHMQAH